ncbi:MAG: OB-fold nucleic acid binding domain-containing protein, partial [Desulfofustis sp.]
MNSDRINTLLAGSAVGEDVVVAGWLRTRRDSSGFSFLEVNDGSSLANIQAIAEKNLPNYDSEIKKLTTGCSVVIRGELKESPAKGQRVEILASSVEVVGWADPEEYPLQKKRHSFEFLREITHLRPRTNALGAVARVRSRLSFAIHQFFHEKDFHQIHTPVITTSDCEGAGEMFQVVTEQELGMKTDSPDSERFFGRRAGLTVSGQLQAEVFAQALGPVYTFGPTFRAENSHTSRHLAEFWMLEPEIPFCDL